MREAVGLRLPGEAARGDDALALRQRLFVLLCLAALVATGAAAYQSLPVEAFPDLTNNQVVVVTEAPGLTSTEVEQRVTRPMEKLLWEIPGVEYIYSTSSPGQSMAIVRFRVGEDEVFYCLVA